LGEVRTAAAVAGVRLTSLVVRATTTSMETTSLRKGVAGGEVCSRGKNINSWKLLVQAHLIGENVIVEFINGQGINSGYDRRHKRIIFCPETFEKKRHTPQNH
jgi:hypothetical protein